MTVVEGGGEDSYLLRRTNQGAKTQLGELRVPTLCRFPLPYPVVCFCSHPELEWLFQMWVSWGNNLKSTLFWHRLGRLSSLPLYGAEGAHPSTSFLP